MSRLLRKLRASFATMYDDAGTNEKNATETHEAYALRIVSKKYDFGSEEQYFDFASQLTKLGCLVASESHLPTEKRAEFRNIRLVVNNRV